MSETITVDGFIYEIDMVYRVGDSYYELVLYDNETKKFTMCSEGEMYSFDSIYEIKNVGTIKKAPVELVSGGYYSFDAEDGGKQASLVGIYNLSTHTFNYHRFAWDTCDCTNITRLIPENEVAK